MSANFLTFEQLKLINLFDNLKKQTFTAEMSTPQFHTDPLSSTHQFHFWTTPFQPQKSLSSTPKTPQFHPPSVPHQKPLSSTLPQFHTLSSTHL